MYQAAELNYEWVAYCASGLICSRYLQLLIGLALPSVCYRLSGILGTCQSRYSVMLELKLGLISSPTFLFQSIFDILVGLAESRVPNSWISLENALQHVFNRDML